MTWNRFKGQRILSAVALLLCVTPALHAADKPIPIIYDTDIGTDVDDAYGLVLAARSPQLDLRAVTTVNAKVDIRAAISRKLLLHMGREDVQVAAGRAKPFDGRDMWWAGFEGKGVIEPNEKVPGISPKPASELIADIASRSQEKIVIVTVGGVGNTAEALQKYPNIKSKIERLVIMGGCVRPLVVQGKKIPERAETNLHNDVDAAAYVLKAGLPITLVPAEVTFLTKLSRADFDRIQRAGTPLAKAMTAMTLEWEPLMKKFMKNAGVESYYDDGVVMLHDPLAVYALANPTEVKREKQRIRVEVGKQSIRTIADPNGPIEIDLVTGVDIAKLSRAVTEAILK